jgi:hypothetical protein
VKRSISELWRTVLVLTTVLILLVAFQNCSAGFNPLSSAPSGSTAGAGTLFSIDTQPADKIVIDGQSAEFSVAVYSTSELTFQWKVNGVDVPGATMATYTANSLNGSQDQDRVSVTISDGSNSITSNEARLTVKSEFTVGAPTEYIVAPSSIDSGLDDSFGSHYVEINPAVSPKGLLFLFFPASLSNPSKDQQIIRSAANNGFHSIGVAYPNGDVVALLCNNSADKGCQSNIREETFTGQDVSTKVSVNEVNSVISRVTLLIKYLESQHPNEGWKRFLDVDGNIRWDLVRVSGHSQGGGTAGYLAIQKSVDRVCTFSSPADYDNASGLPAEWLFFKSKTSPSRFYGFGDTKDNIVPWANLQQIWTALGLKAFGDPVDVDTAVAGFGGSHMLSTSQGNSANGHSIPVVDSATPMDADGFPVFRRVWQYTCFL